MVQPGPPGHAASLQHGEQQEGTPSDPPPYVGCLEVGSVVQEQCWALGWSHGHSLQSQEELGPEERVVLTSEKVKMRQATTDKPCVPPHEHPQEQSSVVFCCGRVRIVTPDSILQEAAF